MGPAEARYSRGSFNKSTSLHTKMDECLVCMDHREVSAFTWSAFLIVMTAPIHSLSVSSLSQAMM